MAEVFILQNQHQHYLSKQNLWLDGRDPGALFKTLHKDEAINQMVEVSSKDYTQRIKILVVEQNEKGLPITSDRGADQPLHAVNALHSETHAQTESEQHQAQSQPEPDAPTGLDKKEQAFSHFLENTLGEAGAKDAQ